MSGLIVLKGLGVLAGLMIAAIQLGYTDKWFCLPLSISGIALMFWCLQL